MTFKARLKSKEFMVALTKRPPQKIAKMLLKAQKYMNAKNAVAAIRDDEKPREGEEKGEDWKGRKEKGETIKVLTKISEETLKLLGW